MWIFFCCFLFKLECTRIQLIVSALFRNKLFVISALDYSALFKHHNYVGVFNRGKSVSNYEYRSALHKLIHTALNDSLSLQRLRILLQV